jgi:hypothetical protein
VEKWRCANIFLKYLEVFSSAELNLKKFHWIGYDYFQKNGFFVQALYRRIASYETISTTQKTDKKTSKVGGLFVASCLS